MPGQVPQTDQLTVDGGHDVAQPADPGAPAAPFTPAKAPGRPAATTPLRDKANIIRNLAFPAAMAAAVPVARDIGGAAFKVYQDGLLRDAGSPSDPVEIMLIEQLSLAHHRIAQLHVQAEQAQNTEAAKVFTTAATRLTGELRRLALALKQYREPSRAKQFTVVRQQNVSAGGQQIAYLDPGSVAQGQIPFHDGGDELGNRRLAYAPQTKFLPESPTASSRPEEPAFARSFDAGRPGAAAADCPPEQALAAIDGTDDAGWQGPFGGQRPLAAEG